MVNLAVVALFFFVGIFSLALGADLIGKPNCEKIASNIEAEAKLPQYLLSSISRVEAGRKLSNGKIRGWPWALNHAGKGLFFESKEEALKYLKKAISSGSKNIDVGCMQLNYRWHKVAFSSLEDMIDPELNVRYAAKFVNELYERHQTWEDVIKHYHSNKERFNVPYLQKVAKVWDLKKEQSIDSNPLMFTDAEKIVPLIETDEDQQILVKPLVIFDAASYSVSQEKIIESGNSNGINFDSRSKIDFDTTPINVPNYLKKHWALVIKLREQLEKN